jgi:hypothetical protein
VSPPDKVYTGINYLDNLAFPRTAFTTDIKESLLTLR